MIYNLLGLGRLGSTLVPLNLFSARRHCRHSVCRDGHQSVNTAWTLMMSLRYIYG